MTPLLLSLALCRTGDHLPLQTAWRPADLVRGQPSRSLPSRLETDAVNAEQEQHYREEAERLATLPPEEQAAYLAWQRAIAADAKLRKADREAARDRADALEQLLSKGRKSRKRL